MQLRVVKDTNNEGIGKLGKIEAQVGMELANGYKVVKVNDKSVIAELNSYKQKFFPVTSIYYTEATCWGFTCSLVNHQAQKKAAIARRFERGEAVFQQHYERNITLLPDDSVERAGYEFALKVQAQRQLAIAKVELIKTDSEKEAVVLTGIVE
jgi:hypothetical protein